MILMRSIKKTQSKFLLRYELGMEESKADKMDPDVVRKDASFELNPSFLALSVKKLSSYHSASAESIEWITF